VVIANTKFSGTISLETNHHCNVGTTGVLCMPMYVFDNVTWNVSSVEVKFSSIANNYGGMLVLSPNDEMKGGDALFPLGYVSIASNVHTHLLNMGSAYCSLASNISNVSNPSMYQGGILCKQTLRTLRIFTNVSFVSTRLYLQVFDVQKQVFLSQTYIPFYSTGGSNKQGFSFPLLANLGDSIAYYISLEGNLNVPSNWVIEFSDLIFGNLYHRRDEIRLIVQGRSCPYMVHSHHDRRFIYADAYNMFEGDIWSPHGACANQPDMPVVNCSGGNNQVQPLNAPYKADLLSCDSICSNNCIKPNAYCDCGLGQCLCNPGICKKRTCE